MVLPHYFNDINQFLYDDLFLQPLYAVFHALKMTFFPSIGICIFKLANSLFQGDYNSLE